MGQNLDFLINELKINGEDKRFSLENKKKYAAENFLPKQLSNLTKEELEEFEGYFNNIIRAIERSNGTNTQNHLGAPEKHFLYLFQLRDFAGDPVPGRYGRGAATPKKIRELINQAKLIAVPAALAKTVTGPAATKVAQAPMRSADPMSEMDLPPVTQFVPDDLPTVAELKEEVKLDDEVSVAHTATPIAEEKEVTPYIEMSLQDFVGDYTDENLAIKELVQKLKTVEGIEELKKIPGVAEYFPKHMQKMLSYISDEKDMSDILKAHVELAARVEGMQHIVNWRKQPASNDEDANYQLNKLNWAVQIHRHQYQIEEKAQVFPTPKGGLIDIFQRNYINGRDVDLNREDVFNPVNASFPELQQEVNVRADNIADNRRILIEQGIYHPNKAIAQQFLQQAFLDPIWLNNQAPLQLAGFVRAANISGEIFEGMLAEAGYADKRLLNINRKWAANLEDLRNQLKDAEHPQEILQEFLDDNLAEQGEIFDFLKNNNGEMLLYALQNPVSDMVVDIVIDEIDDVVSHANNFTDNLLSNKAKLLIAMFALSPQDEKEIPKVSARLDYFKKAIEEVKISLADLPTHAFADIINSYLKIAPDRSELQTKLFGVMDAILYKNLMSAKGERQFVSQEFLANLNTDFLKNYILHVIANPNVNQTTPILGKILAYAEDNPDLKLFIKNNLDMKFREKHAVAIMRYWEDPDMKALAVNQEDKLIDRVWRQDILRNPQLVADEKKMSSQVFANLLKLEYQEIVDHRYEQLQKLAAVQKQIRDQQELIFQKQVERDKFDKSSADWKKTDEELANLYKVLEAKHNTFDKILRQSSTQQFQALITGMIARYDGHEKGVPAKQKLIDYVLDDLAKKDQNPVLDMFKAEFKPEHAVDAHMDVQVFKKNFVKDMIQYGNFEKLQLLDQHQIQFFFSRIIQTQDDTLDYQEADKLFSNNPMRAEWLAEKFVDYMANKHISQSELRNILDASDGNKISNIHLRNALLVSLLSQPSSENRDIYIQQLDFDCLTPAMIRKLDKAVRLQILSITDFDGEINAAKLQQLAYDFNQEDKLNVVNNVLVKLSMLSSVKYDFQRDNIIAVISAMEKAQLFTWEDIAKAIPANDNKIGKGLFIMADHMDNSKELIDVLLRKDIHPNANQVLINVASNVGHYFQGGPLMRELIKMNMDNESLLDNNVTFIFKDGELYQNFADANKLADLIAAAGRQGKVSIFDNPERLKYFPDFYKAWCAEKGIHNPLLPEDLEPILKVMRRFANKHPEAVEQLLEGGQVKHEVLISGVSDEGMNAIVKDMFAHPQYDAFLLNDKNKQKAQQVVERFNHRIANNNPEAYKVICQNRSLHDIVLISGRMLELNQNGWKPALLDKIHNEAKLGLDRQKREAEYKQMNVFTRFFAKTWDLITKPTGWSKDPKYVPKWNEKRQSFNKDAAAQQLDDHFSRQVAEADAKAGSTRKVIGKEIKLSSTAKWIDASQDEKYVSENIQHFEEYALRIQALEPKMLELQKIVAMLKDLVEAQDPLIKQINANINSAFSNVKAAYQELLEAEKRINKEGSADNRDFAQFISDAKGLIRECQRAMRGVHDATPENIAHAKNLEKAAIELVKKVKAYKADAPMEEKLTQSASMAKSPSSASLLKASSRR